MRPLNRLGCAHSSLCSISGRSAPTQDTQEDEQDADGHNSHPPPQQETCGEGDTVQCQGGVFHKCGDVLLGRGNILVQFHVQEAVRILHGHQRLHSRLLLAGLPGEQGIHRLVPCGVYLKLLKLEHPSSYVDGLIHAIVRGLDVQLLTIGEVEGGRGESLCTDKAAR
jgi:hypothetical protein